MMTWMRVRLHGEEGMSLVEVLIAMFVIAVSLLAMLSSMVSSFAAMQGNEARVGATALANEQLEQLMSVPWGRAGLYAGETPAMTYDGEQVALLPNQSPRDALVPLPTETLSRSGRTFTIERWITWVDEGVGGQDIKRMSVIVRWHDGSAPRSLASSSLRGPTPEELAGLKVRITSIENTFTGGTGVRLNPSTRTNEQSIGLTVEVSDPAATVKVLYTDDAASQQEVIVSGSTTTRTVSVPASSRSFAHGDQALIVTAESGSQVASHTASFSFLHDMVVQEPTFSWDGPGPYCTEDGKVYVAEGLLIEVEISGAGLQEVNEIDPITVDWGAGAFAMEFVERTPLGARFSVSHIGPFESGATGWTFYARRAAMPDGLTHGVRDETLHTWTHDLLNQAGADPC